MPSFDFLDPSTARGHTTLDPHQLRPLSARTIDIHQRPFAIDRTTGLAQPGGIFDAAGGRQLIGVFITYHLDPTREIPMGRKGFQCALVAPPDSGIVVDPEYGLKDLHFLPVDAAGTFRFGNGRPALVLFAADFTNAAPGKHDLVFEFQPILQPTNIGPYLVPTGPPEQVVQKTIFVTRTRLSQAENAGVAEVPEGRLVLRHNRVGVFPWADWETWRTYKPTVAILDAATAPPLYVPLEITAEVYPAEPYSGQIGPLPFGDPVWWKWLCGILAAIFAALAALFGKASHDAGATWNCTESEGIGHDYSKQCDLEGPADARLFGAIGIIFGAIASGLVRGMLSDEKDPFRLGEEATAVGPDEHTIKEEVNATFDFTSFFPASGDTAATVAWTFTRTTMGPTGLKTQQTSDTWQRKIHPVAVAATGMPAQVALYQPMPLAVRVTDDGRALRGGEVYVVGWLFGPDGAFRAVPLEDDGTGVFRADTIFEDGASAGPWQLHALVQSVDQAREDDDPMLKVTGDKGGILRNDILRRKDAKGCTYEIVTHATFDVVLPRIR